MSQRSSKASTQVWEVLDFYNGRHKKENANGLMGVDIAELRSEFFIQNFRKQKCDSKFFVLILH